MKKLELKHLAPYLPYGVEVKTLDAIGEIVSIIGTDPFLEVKDYTALDDVLIRVASNNFSDFSTWGISQIKPILRPLSDMDVDREVNTPEYLQGCCYSYVQNRISEHFDVFGLIENGLAIDINTIK